MDVGQDNVTGPESNTWKDLNTWTNESPILSGSFLQIVYISIQQQVDFLGSHNDATNKNPGESVYSPFMGLFRDFYTSNTDKVNGEWNSKTQSVYDDSVLLSSLTNNGDDGPSGCSDVHHTRLSLKWLEMSGPYGSDNKTRDRRYRRQSQRSTTLSLRISSTSGCPVWNRLPYVFGCLVKDRD